MISSFLQATVPVSSFVSSTRPQSYMSTSAGSEERSNPMPSIFSDSTSSPSTISNALGRLIVGRARLLFTEDHGERNPTQIVRLRPQPQRQDPTAHFASIASMSTMAGRSPFTQANTPLSSSCLPAPPRVGRPNRPGLPPPCFRAATGLSRPRCLRSTDAHPAALRSCSRTGA